MGSLFSKEKQPKQSSYNNSRIHQNTHQPPARVSHHINNNVSRVESHAPSSTIKNMNKTTIDYERKWADQRYQMMAHTHKHVLKPPSTQQAPRNIQRQSTITYHSTNIQQQSNNTRQILYKQFQTSQLALKKMPIKLPTWQPMINNRQDKNVKVQNLSRYSQTYNQQYSSANINRMQSSLKSKAINDLYQTPSRNFRQIDHIRSHSVLPSSIKPVAAVFKTKQSHRYGYQNGQIDHNIEQYQEIDFREEKCIFNEFLLNQMLSFKHNRSKVLLTSFNSISQYENIMISLLKQQISSGINQKIQEKKDLRQKDCLKIYLQPRNSRSKFSQKTTGIEIRTRGEDKEELQSLLLMGPCLCAITKSFPFRKGKLMSNEDSTYLCLISNFPPNEQIIAEGLERVVEKHKRSRSLYRKNNQKQEQQLAENEFYLIDITSISSYQKQYIATLRVSQSPLVPVILNNKTMPEPQGEILQRKRSLDITNSKVYYQIVQKRNVSQVAAIKGTFQHSAGIFLIQGPPGTGKTQSITNLISLQYDRNIKNRKSMKILVCAQSNAAVDHIARKIRQNGLIGIQRRPYILKFGCIDQVSEDGLQINLNHICETRVLGTVNKKDQWSASLRTQLENLKNDLKKSRLSNQPSNKIKEIKKKLSQAQKQLTKIRKQLAQKRPEYTRIQMEEISKCEICFSTLNTSGSISTLKGIINKISCLIIDEASQATQPSTLIPLLTNVKKMILVGDHKQLQPTVMSSLANHTMYNRSIFERMTDLGVQPYLLNVQYRMHPELSKFSSDFFYQGRVTDGECKDKTPESLQNLQSRALFIDLKTVKEEQYKKSKINKLEAQCIMSLIKILVKLDNNLQIGVIAPYKAQINLLEQRVAEEFKNRKASVRVSTVDAFQGQQVDVVIFSCTRANKQNKIGFVSDPKRLNVAITRAKHALFVFGNGSTFKKDHTWKAYLEHHLDSATIKIVHEIVKCRQLLIDHIIGEKN